MTILSDIYKFLFGKNYEPVWREFALKNNGIYVVGQYGNLDSVEIVYNRNKIIFDRYVHYQSVGGRNFETDFTRVRLEFKPVDNLSFKITKQGFIDSIGKLAGAQDIQIGDVAFDKKFVIKGNDEFKIQTLFSNKIIRNLISAHEDIQLQILEKEGIFNEVIQEGNSMLYYISETGVKEIGQLNSLLKLYKTLVDQLVKLSSLKPIESL